MPFYFLDELKHLKIYFSKQTLPPIKDSAEYDIFTRIRMQDIWMNVVKGDIWMNMPTQPQGVMQNFTQTRDVAVGFAIGSHITEKQQYELSTKAIEAWLLAAFYNPINNRSSTLYQNKEELFRSNTIANAELIDYYMPPQQEVNGAVGTPVYGQETTSQPSVNPIVLTDQVYSNTSNNNGFGDCNPINNDFQQNWVWTGRGWLPQRPNSHTGFGYETGRGGFAEQPNANIGFQPFGYGVGRGGLAEQHNANIGFGYGTGGGRFTEQVNTNIGFQQNGCQNGRGFFAEQANANIGYRQNGSGPGRSWFAEQANVNTRFQNGYGTRRGWYTEQANANIRYQNGYMARRGEFAEQVNTNIGFQEHGTGSGPVGFAEGANTNGDAEPVGRRSYSDVVQDRPRVMPSPVANVNRLRRNRLASRNRENESRNRENESRNRESESRN